MKGSKMGLKEYQRKRKFDLPAGKAGKTPEPKGSYKRYAISDRPRFVVHDHYAKHHHHDFRLEMDGVLKSWAVPKGVPGEVGVKRLAVSVEGHPIEYASFQGIIPKGQYGAGEVKIFDKGTYNLIKRTENEIEFELFGKKLKGRYVLVRTKIGGQDKNWLLIKK